MMYYSSHLFFVHLIHKVQKIYELPSATAVCLLLQQKFNSKATAVAEGNSYIFFVPSPDLYIGRDSLGCIATNLSPVISGVTFFKGSYLV